MSSRTGAPANHHQRQMILFSGRSRRHEFVLGSMSGHSGMVIRFKSFRTNSFGVPA